jgi:catechol 2,3-dioxygenase-like lactoylglutathione lyase family enzyme
MLMHGNVTLFGGQEMLVGLHHAGVVVPALDDGIRFYSEALDLALVHRGDWEAPNPMIDRIIGCSGTSGMVALLQAPRGYLELFEFKHPSQPPQALSEAFQPGIRHICFESTDPVTALRRVVEHGGERINDPQRIPGGGCAVYCRDPFGNLLEFTTADGRIPSLRQQP